jgi:hypothetical protein
MPSLRQIVRNPRKRKSQKLILMMAAMTMMTTRRTIFRLETKMMRRRSLTRSI